MIIRGNNIQKWLFDYFEGNLTPHEQIELRNFISQNPAYQSEFDAWEKSYPPKDAKSKKNRIPFYAGASSLLVETSILVRFNWKYAASIVMFIVGGSLIGYYNMPSDSVKDILSINTENMNGFSLIEKGETSSDSKEVILSKEKNKVNENTVSENLTQENNNENYVVSNESETNNLTNKTNVSTSINKGGYRGLSQGFSNESESNNTSSTKGKEIKSHNDETKRSKIALNEQSQDNLRLETELGRRKSVNEKKLSKLNPKSVVFFDSKIDRNVRFHSEKRVKKDKRYFYTGFKDLAGRGLGVRGKKSKKDKEFNRDRNISDENIMITENGGGDKSNINDPERARKKKSRKNSDLALMNLYDPIFISTNSHPLSVNASLAGELGIPRIKSTFRLQNTNSKDYLTNSVNSFDMYISELQAGVGLVFSNSRLNSGVYSDSKVEFVYAQKFEISRESSFTTSIKYSGRQIKMNASKMDYNSQIEVERGVVYTTFLDASSNVSTKSFRNDLGVATWYDGRYLYGGVQVDNLLRSKAHVYNESMNDNRLSRSFSAQIGTDYRKSLYSNIVISPQISFNSQERVNELWAGATIKYRSLVTGLGVGMLNATSLKGMLGIQNHVVRLMYGFDYSNSALESGMFASHEISLRVLLGAKRHNWSRFKK